MEQKDSANRGKLAKKIEEVAVAIGNLEKDGRNEFSKYNYISAEQLNSSLKVLFKKHKLSIIPEVLETQEKDYEAKGKISIRTRVKMTFELIDHDTGYSIIKNFSGAEQDTGGKSMQQAITQCTKYFYFKLFRVSDKGDVDGDSKTAAPVKKFKPAVVEEVSKAFPLEEPKQLPMATDKQKAAIFAMWDELYGLVCTLDTKKKIEDKTSVRKETMMKMFNIDSTTKITKKDAIKFIDIMEKGIAKRQKDIESKIEEFKEEVDLPEDKPATASDIKFDDEEDPFKKNTK